jgi:hypothetical protein
MGKVDTLIWEFLLGVGNCVNDKYAECVLINY